MGHLPQRMREAAHYYTFRQKALERSQDVESFHDLNPSCRFMCSDVTETVNTIICSSVIWQRLSRKVLAGFELLMLQGYPLDLITTTEVSNSHLTELAGNAFNAWAVAPIALLIVGLIPLSSTSSAECAKAAVVSSSSSGGVLPSPEDGKAASSDVLPAGVQALTGEEEVEFASSSGDSDSDERSDSD